MSAPQDRKDGKPDATDDAVVSSMLRPGLLLALLAVLGVGLLTTVHDLNDSVTSPDRRFLATFSAVAAAAPASSPADSVSRSTCNTVSRYTR